MPICSTLRSCTSPLRRTSVAALVRTVVPATTSVQVTPLPLRDVSGPSIDADESGGDAEEKIEKRRQKIVFFDERPDFELEGRKGRVSAQKSDHHGVAQIFAYLIFVGQKDQQKADQKRPRDIDKKRR